MIHGRPWLEKFHSDAEKDNFEGWLIPELLDIVQSDIAHEIASHGFTHLPLSESLIDRNSFLNEMNKMKMVMNLKMVYVILLQKIYTAMIYILMIMT